MTEAGLSREAAYVTNVVKHFKWELRGKRRLHKTPVQREIDACRPWLEAELSAVRPALVVCLGATATHALVPGRPALTELRGRILPSSDGGPAQLATVHPSYVLRMRSEGRSQAFAGLVADLKVAARFLEARSGSPASSPKR